MKSSHLKLLGAFAVLHILSTGEGVQGMKESKRLKLRDQTKSLWDFGYDNYMTYAYPEDELKPISCKGQSRDTANPNNYARNDVNGDYSLTFLDVLSTLPLFRGEEEFVRAVDKVIKEVRGFDRDVKVQVFEVTIRILGSLLSSYQQLLDIEQRDHIHKTYPELTLPSFSSSSSSSSSTSSRESKFRIATGNAYKLGGGGEGEGEGLVAWLVRKTKGPLRRTFGRNVTVDGGRGGGGSKGKRVQDVLEAVMEGEEATGKRLSRRERRQRIKAALATFQPSQRSKTLLAMAKDLGDRLIPAFNTPTGMPYARINLRSGIDPHETEETCAAATTSLTLEFTLLSRLTNNPIYENLARKAFFSTWERRVPGTNLVGNQIGVISGQWMGNGISSTGAGIDSFFEYALKGGMVWDEQEYVDVWEDAYRGVMQHVRSPDGYVFRGVHLRAAQPIGQMVDSLSAFWPGLQVVAGDVRNAIKSHLFYWHLWQKHSAMPEGFNYINKTAEWSGYPLRPEFIESTYWLYRATGDHFYLEVGRRILRDLEKRTKVRCGFAVLHNVFSGSYLYLLFDHDNKINSDIRGGIFTTEGHILRAPPSPRIRKPSDGRSLSISGGRDVCAVPRAFELDGLKTGITMRPDYDYTRLLVDMPMLGKEYHNDWTVCAKPENEPYHFEIAFSASNDALNLATIQNMDEMRAKYAEWDSRIIRSGGDLEITDVQGVRGFVTRSPDGRTYDVTSVGNHRIRPGQQVILSDPAVASYLPAPQPPLVTEEINIVENAKGTGEVRPSEVIVQLSFWGSDDAFESVNQPPSTGGKRTVWEGIGATSTFGQAMTPLPVDEEGKGTFRDSLMTVSRDPMVLVPALYDITGCAAESYDNYSDIRFEKRISRSPFIALTQRGGCTFQQKAVVAQKAGATGVIVWGNDDHPGLVRPASDPEWETVSREIRSIDGDEQPEIGMVYIPRLAGLAALKKIGDGHNVYAQLRAFRYAKAIDQPKVGDIAQLLGLEGVGRILNGVEVGIKNLLETLTEILGVDDSVAIEMLSELEDLEIDEEQQDADPAREGADEEGSGARDAFAEEQQSQAMAAAESGGNMGAEGYAHRNQHNEYETTSDRQPNTQMMIAGLPIRNLVLRPRQLE